MVEGELIQAIGRGREIRRTVANPLDVLLLCNVPLPFEVDDFTTWAEVQPQPWEVMAARGVVLEAKPGDRGAWSVGGAVLGKDGRKLAQAAQKQTERCSLATMYIIPPHIQCPSVRDLSPTVHRIGVEPTSKLGVMPSLLRFSPDADLAAIFGTEAEITITEEPINQRPADLPAYPAQKTRKTASAAETLLRIRRPRLPKDGLLRYLALKDWQRTRASIGP